MQERYLFRGKTISGDWVQGLLASTDGKWYISNKAGKPFAYEIRPESICQCTGLKCENDKLIWENDIIKNLFTGEQAPIRYGSYQSCFNSAKTEHVGFYVDWSGTYSKNYRKDLGYWIRVFGVKIIGNVFDDLERLEVDDESTD